MTDQEVVKRLDEISDRLDELAALTKRNAERVEATLQFVGKFEANLTLDLSAERPFGVKANDRISVQGSRGTVVGVGPSISGPQAVIAFDAGGETAQYQVLYLTRLDDEAS